MSRMMERTTRNGASRRAGRSRWLLGLWVAAGVGAGTLLAEAQGFRSANAPEMTPLAPASKSAHGSLAARSLRRPPADRMPRWFGIAPEPPVPETSVSDLRILPYTPLPAVTAESDAAGPFPESSGRFPSPLAGRLVGLPLNRAGKTAGPTSAATQQQAASDPAAMPPGPMLVPPGDGPQNDALHADGPIAAHADRSQPEPIASSLPQRPATFAQRPPHDPLQRAEPQQGPTSAPPASSAQIERLPSLAASEPSKPASEGAGADDGRAARSQTPQAPRPIVDGGQAADMASSMPLGGQASTGRGRTGAQGAASRVDRELQLVARQAAVHTRRGFAQANRMALFSARAEFIEALSIVAQAVDAVEQTNVHTQALAAGLRALKEADDFVIRGSRLEADIDLATVVAGHRTPVLKGDDVQRTDEGLAVSTLVARQRYYSYAQQQLALAAAGQPAASMALYGLGRVYAALAAEQHQLLRDPMPKALVFHQAALEAQPSNYLAANEIGVLLTQFGRYAEARRALEHSVSVKPQATTWHNLAVVLDHLGDRAAAHRARELSIAMSRGQGGGAAVAGANQPTVQWVRPETLAATSAGEPVPVVKPRDASKPQPRGSGSGAAPSSTRRGLSRVIPWLAPEEKQMK